MSSSEITVWPVLAACEFEVNLLVLHLSPTDMTKSQRLHWEQFDLIICAIKMVTSPV